MVSIPSGLVTFFVRFSALSTFIRFVRLVRLAVRCGTAAACLSFTATAFAADKVEPVVVVLGDSLSAGYGIKMDEGWVSLLAKRLAAEGYGYRVVNASVSGETTQGGLARLPRVLELNKPAIVVVELGGNDGLRGLQLAVSRANLAKIIERSRAAGARVVLAGMMIPPNYGQRYTEEFRDMFAALATQYQIPLVPFLLDKVALDPALMQADGIHPNARAQPRILDNLWPKLKPLLVAPRRVAR
jgi:acyl-CoA thioesterase I